MPPKPVADPNVIVDPSKKVTMPLTEFLDMQDKLANAMATYRGIAVKILEASSNSLSITTDALTNLHSFTISTLGLSDLKPEQIPIGAYPTIGALLKQPKEKIRDFDSLRLPHQGIGDKAKRAAKPKKQKDPDAPKRPETAYLRFANAKKEDYREKMRKDNPNVSNGEIAKQLTADWHSLGEGGQKYWKDVYQVELQEYNRKKAEYEKRTGKRVDDKAEEVEPTASGASALAGGKQQSSIEEGIANALSGSDDDDDSSESSSDDDDSSPSPPPAVKAKAATPKGGKSKAAKVPEVLSPTKKGKDDSKKKRKADDDEDEADKKKSKKSKKDDKTMSNIDPRLEKMEKEKKRQKRKNTYGEDY